MVVLRFYFVHLWYDFLSSILDVVSVALSSVDSLIPSCNKSHLAPRLGRCVRFLLPLPKRDLSAISCREASHPRASLTMNTTQSRSHTSTYIIYSTHIRKQTNKLSTYNDIYIYNTYIYAQAENPKPHPPPISSPQHATKCKIIQHLLPRPHIYIIQKI